MSGNFSQSRSTAHIASSGGCTAYRTAHRRGHATAADRWLSVEQAGSQFRNLPHQDIEDERTEQHLEYDADLFPSILCSSHFLRKAVQERFDDGGHEGDGHNLDGQVEHRANGLIGKEAELRGNHERQERHDQHGHGVELHPRHEHLNGGEEEQHDHRQQRYTVHDQETQAIEMCLVPKDGENPDRIVDDVIRGYIRCCTACHEAHGFKAL